MFKFDLRLELKIDVAKVLYVLLLFMIHFQ